MKTAMQTFLDALKEIGYTIEESSRNKLLEKEKQQIIDCWENGYSQGGCVNTDKDKYHGNQYYNETFKND